VSASSVRSIAALRELRLATLELAQRLGELGFDLRSESERAMSWIREDAPRYWRTELRLAQRRLSEAEDALAAMQSRARPAERPASSELRQRVAVARRRVDLCEARLRACKTAAIELDRYRERLVVAGMGLQHQAESQLPQAARRLGGWIEALDRYAETPPPSSPPAGDPSNRSGET
jgi:hypothetical protein